MRLYLLLFLSLITACSSINKVTNARNDGFNDSYEYISIMQGATTDNETVINFIAPKIATYSYKVLDDKGTDITSKSKISKVHSREYSEWQVVEVKVEGLSPSIKYEFQVELKVGKYADNDSRYFYTLDTKKEDYKILIASCMADSYHQIGDKAWATVEEQELDAFFLIGDLVYADYFNGRYLGIPSPDMRHAWSRYIDSRFALKLYQLKQLKPVFATWDDHDLGINNGDKHYKKLKQVSSVFRGFFPNINNDSISKGKGVGFKLTLGSNDFFFLDNRSFRDKNKKKNGYHLGRKQVDWITSNAKKTNRLNWLVQGDQFFGGYHRHESFEGMHPERFDQFLQKLKETNKKYVFISGDRHLYEFMRLDSSFIGHQTYEITTSGFHAKIFPNGGSNYPNKHRVSIVDDHYNSVILNLSSESHSIRAMNENGKTLDTQKMPLK